MKVLFFLLTYGSLGWSQMIAPPFWSAIFRVPELSTGSLNQCPSRPNTTLSIPLTMTAINVSVGTCSASILTANITGTPVCTCSGASCTITGTTFTDSYLISLPTGVSGTITNAIDYSVTSTAGTQYGTLDIVARTGTWTPACLGAAVKVWFDASDNSTVFFNAGTTVQATNGSIVSVWHDKSGNDFHMTGTATRQPVYGTLAINGLNVVTVAGTKQIKGAATQNYNIFNDRTLVGILRPNTLVSGAGGDGAGTYFFDRESTHCCSGNPLFSLKNSGGYMMLQKRDTAGGQIGGGTFGAAISTGNTYLVSVMRNTGTIYGWLDANNVRTQTITGTNQTQSPIALGHSTSFMSGSVTYGEFLMTVTVLGTAQLSRVEGYLAHKWGTNGSLPGSHFFKTSPP